MYAVAASAAGVSLLALAQPAEGKIIYTKVHHVIGEGESYGVDLNHDGTIDFRIAQKHSDTGFGNRYWLGVEPRLGNYVEGEPSQTSSGHLTYLASALTPGEPIGASQHFFEKRHKITMFTLDTRGGSYGFWRDVSNRYLGLSFHIKGQSHYGWVRLSVQVSVTVKFQISATVTGYAYETVPGKTIIAGKTKGPDVIAVQPGSIGHLARGAVAIPAWRMQPNTTPVR